MNKNQLDRKRIRDQNYWTKKLEQKKEYEKNEEKWRKDLMRLNPEHP